MEICWRMGGCDKNQMINIDTRLRKVFRKCFGRISEKSEELTKDNMDVWDSLTHIKLIMEIENEFEIVIDPEAIPQLHTNFNAIDKYLEAYECKK